MGKRALQEKKKSECSVAMVTEMKIVIEKAKKKHTMLQFNIFFYEFKYSNVGF